MDTLLHIQHRLLVEHRQRKHSERLISIILFLDGALIGVSLFQIWTGS